MLVTIHYTGKIVHERMIESGGSTVGHNGTTSMFLNLLKGGMCTEYTVLHHIMTVIGHQRKLRQNTGFSDNNATARMCMPSRNVNFGLCVYSGLPDMNQIGPQTHRAAAMETSKQTNYSSKAEHYLAMGIYFFAWLIAVELVSQWRCCVTAGCM